MKRGQQLTAPPTGAGLLVNWSKRTDTIAATIAWKQRLLRRLPDHRELLLAMAVSLIIASLFLTGGYLFLVQLAEHGW